MLHYDRRPVAEKRQEKNFLSINKNSVRNKPKKAKQKDEEIEQRKMPLQGRQKEKQRNRPSSTNNSKPTQETVTISKDYLDKLLGALQNNTHTSSNTLPLVVATDYNNVQLPQLGPPKHVVIDHNKIPGLEKPVPHNIQSNPAHNGQPTISSYSSDIINTSLLSIESPRGGGGDTYHRGTINRPIHPAMKSQIVFGAGPGWGTDNQQQEREEAKLKWMNELAEQINVQNSPVTRKPVSMGVGMADKIPIVHGQDYSQVELMKAENMYNPSSVTGRGGGGTTQISVGLQLQRSPKELTEKKLKELEHRQYLLAQIEEKKRKKDEEKMKRDREAIEEERRLVEDKERLAREFEMEKQMHQRKKIDEARKLAILQERIKLAEQSAFEAKQEMKKSRRQGNDKQHDNRVKFQNQSQVVVDPAINNSQVLYNSNDDNSVLSSFDMRSPSLHTIPIVTSPRNVKNSYEKPGTRIKASSLKPGPSVLSTNSQVSLYSSSSEEPLNAIKKKTRFKPDHPSSGKKIGLPGTIRESRIPRKTILRRQLGKNIPAKSESESEGRNPTIRRAITNHAHQLPNSVVKLKNKTGSQHTTTRYNRPSSTDSQDGNSQAPTRHHLIKSRSLPSEKKTVEEEIPIVQSRTLSPPVPAVARRLAEAEHTRKPTKDVSTNNNPMIINEEIHVNDDNQLHVNNHKMKIANRPRSARLRRNDPLNNHPTKTTNDSYDTNTNNGFKLPEIVLSTSTIPSTTKPASISYQPLPVITNGPSQPPRAPIQSSNVPILPPIPTSSNNYNANPSFTVPPLSNTNNHMNTYVRAPSYPPDNNTTNTTNNNGLTQDKNHYKSNQNTLTPIMEEGSSREERRESIPSENGVYRLNSRQRALILANLAKLKEGIIIQSQNVNSRISSVLSKKHY